MIFKAGAASPAEGPTPQLYVISVTGDGGQTTVVEESQLKQALHEAYCSCGKQWDKCEDEVVKLTLAKTDAEEQWTRHYPDYKRHIWTDHGEDYTVQVMRVSYVAGKIRASGPKPRCPKCQSLKINRVYAFDGAASSMKDVTEFCVCRNCNHDGALAAFFTPSAGEPQPHGKETK
jgi:hypothetical protein